jgi:two-component system, NarL family, invasion response regulator UvrY
MRRILIADDHSVVRKGLKQILKGEFPSVHIEEAANAEDLLKKVMAEEWDMVISDISMPGKSGLDVLAQIRQVHPKLPYLVLSMYPEEQYAIRVLKAGASGYLNKDSLPEELLKAVNRVLSGKKYITPSTAEKLATTFGQNGSEFTHESLSNREFEVLKLLAAGKSVSDIAEQLSLSASTISTYRARIMLKMNLKTNADLILHAINHKLI